MNKINAEKIKPEDIGERKTKLEMDHQEAIQYVKKICEENNLGIITEFSPSKILEKKLGSKKQPYYVLGACNPEVADLALEQTKKIGGLFPCNIVIWEEEPGKQIVYHVSIMKIARLLGIAPENQEWEEIISMAGENINSTFKELEK